MSVLQTDLLLRQGYIDGEWVDVVIMEKRLVNP